MVDSTWYVVVDMDRSLNGLLYKLSHENQSGASELSLVSDTSNKMQSSILWCRAWRDCTQ